MHRIIQLNTTGFNIKKKGPNASLSL